VKFLQKQTLDHISEQVKKFISIEHKKQGSKKEKEKEKAFI
jgi:hypothetical protein